MSHKAAQNHPRVLGDHWSPSPSPTPTPTEPVSSPSTQLPHQKSMMPSAFVLTPFQVRHVQTRALCMGPRTNRYNPAFQRFNRKISTPSNGQSIDHTQNGQNGNPVTDIASPPPPTPPKSDDRSDRPDDQEGYDDLSPSLHDKEATLTQKWPALHNRLLANPRLPLQLAVELFVGLVSKTLAEVQARGENFYKEFDHYLCNLSLELFGDAMLVWLLSPIAGASGATLPKHFLQIGGYTTAQRVGGFLYKGAQFGVVGVLSSAVGQGVTRALVKARGGDTGELPEVWPNCVAWGGFLLLSSNTRYQLINGFEQRVLEKSLPGGLVGAAITFAVRFGNCYVGGVQWLPWARFLGVQ